MFAITLFALSIAQEPQVPARITKAIEPAVVAEDLLPAQTYAVVRVRSLDRLAEIALPYQRIDDEKAQPMDVLALVSAESGIEAKWQLVDRKQPLLIAVSNSSQGLPVAITVIASSTDAATFAADPAWESGPFKCEANGNFVVIGMEPSEGRLPRESTLRSGLDRGDIVARVDFQEVMAQFGEVIQAQVYGELDKSADEGAPDVEIQTGERVLDSVFEWLDSAEALGFSIQAVDERMQFDFELVARPNTVLSNVEPVDTRELEKLVRCIDPASPIAFVSAMDPSKWMKGMFSMFDFDALLADAGEEGEQAKAALNSAAELYENIGPLTAGGMRFSKSGFAATYALRPKDPQKLIEAYRKMLAIDPTAMQVESLPPTTLAGREVQRMRIKMVPPAPPGGTTSDLEAEQAKAKEAMTKLFGTDAFPFSYTVHEGRMLATLGPDAEMEAAIGRSASTSTSPAGRELLSMLGTLNPGWAMRIDVPTLAQSIVDVASVMGEELPPNAEQCVALFQNCRPIDLRFGLEQRTWRLSLDVDGLRLARAFKRMDEMNSPNLPAANEVRDSMPPK